jgi:hypothetical protein
MQNGTLKVCFFFIISLDKKGSFEGDISTLYGCNSHPQLIFSKQTFTFLMLADKGNGGSVLI